MKTKKEATKGQKQIYDENNNENNKKQRGRYFIERARRCDPQR